MIRAMSRIDRTAVANMLMGQARGLPDVFHILCHPTPLQSGVRDHFAEIEEFIIRQPPKGGKDDYDSENSWISDGLPSSSRRRRRGDGR
jgi:hypothetical protein